MGDPVINWFIGLLIQVNLDLLIWMTTFTIHNWGMMSSIVVRPQQIAARPHPRRSFLGMCIQAEGECAKQQW